MLAAVREGVEDAVVIVLVGSLMHPVNSKKSSDNTDMIWRNLLVAITVINTFTKMIINLDQATRNLSG